MEDDPSHRLSLLDGCNDGSQYLAAPSRVPSIVNLASHRHLDPSTFLPLFHPAPACFPSSTGSGFSHYPEPPRLAPMVEVGSGFGSEDLCSPFPNLFFSMDSITSPPYTALDVPAMISLALPPASPNQGMPSMLPLMVGHSRSHSDIPLGFSWQNRQMTPLVPVKPEVTMIESYQSEGVATAALNGLGMLASSSSTTQEWCEQIDNQVCVPQGWSSSDSRENEAKSLGDSSTPHYCRSLSVDSFMMGNLNIGAVSQQISSPLLPTTEENAGGSGSIGSAAAPFTGEFVNVKFSEDEKKKIMENQFLSDIVLTDPKRVKRILNNRASAAKSKENKMKYIAELESKIQVLQTETAMLSAQVTVMQRNNDGLVSHNNDLKIRLQAMNQQAQCKDALTEGLTAEIQHLKVVAGEIIDPNVPTGSRQQLSSYMDQLQQLLTQRKPSQTQQDQPQ